MEKLRGINLPMPRFLQEDIPEGVRGIYGYRNLQTFFPTLSKVFRVNKYQAAKVAYDLPSSLAAVDCSGGQGFCEATLKKKDGTLTNDRIFLKVTHLLDPVRWMQGRYSPPRRPASRATRRRGHRPGTSYRIPGTRPMLRRWPPML